MRSVTLLLMVAGLGLSPTVAGAQATDPLGLAPVVLPPALDRVLRDYEVAWASGDGKRLAAVFTEDGFALTSGALPIRGREAIAASITRPGGSLQLRAFAWSTSDSVGYIVGGYRYPQTEGPGGKFLLALRKSADRWLIAADMDNAASRTR